MSNGSPVFSISGMVHLRSNAFDSTILKICMLLSGRFQPCGSTRAHLLHVDAVACTTEYQTGTHRLGEPTGLTKFVNSSERKGSKHTWFDISSWSCGGKLTKWSYLVPIKNGIAVLLNPRPCLYHSLIELSVLFLVRSNMKRMATASLQTRGSMLTNSRCPPRSQIENVISVFRIDMVFSMKLTPGSSASTYRATANGLGTQCLNVVFIPAALDVFDHQTGFPNLCIAHHANLDHHAALCLVTGHLV